jgi:hypothetical protein
MELILQRGTQCFRIAKSRKCEIAKSMLFSSYSEFRILKYILRAPYALHFAFCIFYFAFCNPSYTFGDAPTAVPVDGRPFAAERITAIDEAWQVTFQTGENRHGVPASDLVRWGRCVEPGRGGIVILADGGWLAGDVTAADPANKRLAVDSPSLGTVDIPREIAAGILFRAPSDPRRRDNWLDRLIRTDGRSDRLFLDNGDQIDGVLDGVSADAVRWRSEIGPIAVKTDRAAAVLFDPAARRYRQPTAAEKIAVKAWIGLADGSRLSASRLAVNGELLTITSAGQTWKTALKNLVFLQPLGGRVAYLSDLKPAEHHQTPYLDIAWPYKTDRNVAGGMLRCGGRLFLKGIGVHSADRLVYNVSPRPPAREGSGFRIQGSDSADHPSSLIPHPLSGKAPRRFEAEIGIDDLTDGGSVVFRVLVDGRERFASKTVRGGDLPVPVSVDLAGAKKLELIVEYADRADVLDHADWLDARLAW